MTSGRGVLIAGEARKRRERGHAAVETALMAPWIFLLFVVVVDLGYYSYAAIATANAARSAAMYTSQGSSYVTDLTGACQIARRELQGMPNVGANLATCAAGSAVSAGQPVGVAVAAIAGPDATPLGAAQVAVTYRSPRLFPLPGIMGQMTLTRVVEARVRDN